MSAVTPDPVEAIARRLTRQLGALVVRCLPEAWEVDVTTDAAVEASEAYALVLAALAAERQRADALATDNENKGALLVDYERQLSDKDAALDEAIGRAADRDDYFNMAAEWKERAEAERQRADAAESHREAAWHAAQSYFIRALRDRASERAEPIWDAVADYLNTLDRPDGGHAFLYDPQCPLCVLSRGMTRAERERDEARAERNARARDVMHAEAALAAERQRTEQLEVQLAGISVAASGWANVDGDAKQGDYGWSVPFDDVKNLRVRMEAAEARVAALAAAIHSFLGISRIQRLEDRNYLHEDDLAILRAALAPPPQAPPPEPEPEDRPAEG